MKAIKENHIHAYIRLWAGKKTIYQIAQDLNINYGTVSRYAWLMGVSLACKQRTDKRKKLIAIITEHHATHTASECAKMAGVIIGTVYYRAWLMKVQFKPTLKQSSRRQPVKAVQGMFNESIHENWLV